MIYEVLVTMCQTINEALKTPEFVVKKESDMSRITNRLTVRVIFHRIGDEADVNNKIIAQKEYIWPQGEEPVGYNQKIDQFADECATSIIVLLFNNGLTKYLGDRYRMIQKKLQENDRS